jgi:hypothetical protein
LWFNDPLEGDEETTNNDNEQLVKELSEFFENNLK